MAFFMKQEQNECFISIIIIFKTRFVYCNTVTNIILSKTRKYNININKKKKSKWNNISFLNKYYNNI